MSCIQCAQLHWYINDAMLLQKQHSYLLIIRLIHFITCFLPENDESVSSIVCVHWCASGKQINNPYKFVPFDFSQWILLSAFVTISIHTVYLCSLRWWIKIQKFGSSKYNHKYFIKLCMLTFLYDFDIKFYRKLWVAKMRLLNKLISWQW